MVLLLSGLLLTGCSGSRTDSAEPLPARPGCAPTEPGDSYQNTEVQFPLRADLPDLAGVSRRIEITGYVLDADCSPVESALVKFWASRENGEYTQDSYGSVLSAADGSYRVTLPAPIAYAGRPAHVHLETTIGNQAVFTEIFTTEDADAYVVEFVPPAVEPPPSTTPGPTNPMP